MQATLTINKVQYISLIKIVLVLLHTFLKRNIKNIAKILILALNFILLKIVLTATHPSF